MKEEKLQEAKRLYESANADQKYVLESLFPELKESEDEQIRKELTKHLKEGVEGYMPAGDSSDYRRWLDWLEKQDKSSDQIHYWTEEEIESIISDYLRGAEHYGGMIARLRCLKPKSLEKQDEQKQEINNFDVLPGLYKCVHRMFDGTPEDRLLFEVGNVYRCLSKHDRAEFEVSYGHSVYLEDPVVCKHFIPFEKQDEVESDNDDIEVEEKGIREAFNKIEDEKQCKQKPQRMISAEAKEAMYDKPSDKVEPKFKVGDWVVYYRNDSSREVLQVYDIRDGRYYFTDNVHFSWSVKECDEKSHLWTIQDAKDGDVLANNTIVLIVDHLGTFEHRPIIYSWYFANSEKFYGMGTSVPDRWEVKGFTPATKEQCNLLFSKMREAGYEWDDEKKELKLLITNGGDFFESENCEQKPVWSEEDEVKINRIVACLENLNVADNDILLKDVDWLKSLKQRIGG